MAAFLVLASLALAAPVHLAVLDGGVDPGSADYLAGAIARAEREGAAALVLRLDTPGGLVQSAREIVAAELNAEVPVVVWVGPAGARAASAGTFITLAAHVAAMAPGTTIGAAHPVSLFGGGIGGGGDAEGEDGRTPGEPEAMGQKILQDTLAWARAIAGRRGRNAGWAEAAVRHSEALTAAEAMELGVADLLAPDLRSLLRAIDGRVVELPGGPAELATAGARIVSVAMTPRQRALHVLGDPNVLYALIGLGLLGLWVEVKSPGLVVPGVLGAGMLLAAAVGLSVLPFSTGGLLLVLFGFGAFAAELWIGGHGVYAVAGAAGLVLGGVLLFDVEGFDLRVDPRVLAAVGGGAAACAMLVATMVARAHRQRVSTGAEGLAGEIGVVVAGGEGGGRVRVMGEDWAAMWDGEQPAGRRVRGVAVHGLVLDVEPAGGGEG